MTGVRETVDLATFRDVLSQVAMPVAIVSAFDYAGVAHGLTVGSLCSLSAVPPLVLVCIDRTGLSGRHIVTADRFGLSVLSAEQRDLARAFATHGTRRRDALVLRDGLPAVPDAVGWLACARHDVLDGGDHHILVGRVTHARRSAGSPLIYHDRGYRRIRRGVSLRGIAKMGRPRPEMGS